MYREPTIHVTIGVLGMIIGEVTGNYPDDNTLKEILSKAKGYSTDKRSFIIFDDKLAKKTRARTSSNTKDANLLADILYSTRIKMRHINVKKIGPKDPLWSQVKTLVPLVNDFCKQDGLKKREGYIRFIETGLRLLSDSKKPNWAFCLKWMTDRVDWVISTVRASRAIEADEDQNDTRIMYEEYQRAILERTGIRDDVKPSSPEYVHFIRARKLADSYGIDYDVFIDAQFEALEFCNGIPSISDLDGDKAKSRLIRYLSKHNIRVVNNIEDTAKVSKEIWDKFKK